MSFKYPWMFFFIVLQIIVILILKYKKNDLSSSLPNASEKVLRTLEEKLDKNKILWKNRIIMLGLFFLTIASTGPQIGTKVRPIERKGVDLVIALDTSTSMNDEDVKPSRLEKTKFEIGQLIRKLKGDRVAIIVFAGSSHLYLPLTTDYDAALLFLDQIDTEIIPTQGTSISSAMKTSISAFSEQKDKYKVLIIFTDGEDHEGESIKAAEQAVKMGLSIYAVGVGSEQGGLIPEIKNNKGIKKYKKDKNGKLITSKINKEILQKITSIGNGGFFWFDNNRDSHKDILETITSLDKKTISTHEYSDYEDRYQLISILSLLLFMIGLLIPTQQSSKY